MLQFLQPFLVTQQGFQNFRFGCRDDIMIFFREETDEISKFWMVGLYNNHIDAQRFIIDDDRIMFNAMVNILISPNKLLFSVQEGSLAYEVKDYLIEQERVEYVEIDQEIFPGKFSKQKTEL